MCVTKWTVDSSARQLAEIHVVIWHLDVRFPPSAELPLAHFSRWSCSRAGLLHSDQNVNDHIYSHLVLSPPSSSMSLLVIFLFAFSHQTQTFLQSSLGFLYFTSADCVPFFFSSFYLLSGKANKLNLHLQTGVGGDRGVVLLHILCGRNLFGAHSNWDKTTESHSVSLCEENTLKCAAELKLKLQSEALS